MTANRWEMIQRDFLSKCFAVTDNTLLLELFGSRHRKPVSSPCFMIRQVNIIHRFCIVQEAVLQKIRLVLLEFGICFPLGSHKLTSVLIFFAFYFFLSCWTYGLSVSSGLFIPSLLTGAAWGRVVGTGMEYFFPDSVSLKGVYLTYSYGLYS